MISQVALLADIHRQSFPVHQVWSEQSFAELLVQLGVQLYLHEQQGFLLTRHAADEMEILTIAVLPSHRCAGVARKLMQQALKEAREARIKSCFLEVDGGNVPAIGLYTRLGFEVVAVRKNYYKTSDSYRDAQVMDLRLT